MNVTWRIFRTRRTFRKHLSRRVTFNTSLITERTLLLLLSIASEVSLALCPPSVRRRLAVALFRKLSYTLRNVTLAHTQPQEACGLCI